MEAAYRPKGERFDIDKEEHEMNAEERAAYAALEADDGAYEELEDDFIFLANEGKAAVELVEEEVVEGEADSKKPFSMAEADFRSRDIHIVTDDDVMDEEDKALKEYRERMAAMLPTAGANFAGVMDGQDELDAGFDAFMDEEYNEDQIGELMEEEIDARDKINKRVLDEACDEFIEGTKRRFLDLAKEFGDERANKLFPDVKPSDLVHEEDLVDGQEPEEVKQKIREKKLANADDFEVGAEDQGDEDLERDAEKGEAEWDAETILSTYTNTDNHPGVIKTSRRVRPN